MRARRIWAAAAAVALLGLSGCVRVHADFIIQPDDTVDGAMVIAVSEAYLTAEGYTHDELLSEIMPIDHEGLPGTLSSEGEYQQDGYYGYQIAFTQGTLEQFNTGSELAVAREGDVFSFHADLAEDIEHSGLSESELETAEMRVSVTFPGEVLEHNGSEVVGNTVVWLVTAQHDPVLQARGSALANGLAAPYTAAPVTVAPEPNPDPEPHPTVEPDAPQPPREGELESAAAPAPDNADFSLPDGAAHPAVYVLSGLVVVLVAGLVGRAVMRRRAVKA